MPVVSAEPSLTAASSSPHLSRCGVPRLFKRTVDVAIASAALIALSPLLLLLGVLIKCTSRGPVVFRQQRLGLGRRPFVMFKLRTMVADAEARRREVVHLNEARGSVFKIRRDPRLTPIGHLLRRTSLDEIPQFLNVLRGEMSLVGPRPLPAWLVDDLAREAGDLPVSDRFSVLPGMTGEWQVRGRVQDSRQLLLADLDYVHNWSARRDLQILAATPFALLQDDEPLQNPLVSGR